MTFKLILKLWEQTSNGNTGGEKGTCKTGMTRLYVGGVVEGNMKQILSGKKLDHVGPYKSSWKGAWIMFTLKQEASIKF